MELTLLDIAVVVVYFAALSLIGVYFSGRQTSREEYLLGDRNMHWLLVGGSVMATMLSTLTFLSMPGEMIRYGVAYFSGLVVIPLIVPVVNRVLIPTLRSLPITSAYEYLEKRFDVRFRSLASSVFVFRTLLWMGLIIYSCSFAVSEITRWNLYLTILVTGLITIFYTSAGGLRTVVWTDNLQLLVLFGGAIAIPVVIGFSIGSGPVAWWHTFSQAGRTHIQVFSWDLTVRVTVIGTVMAQFFWNICTHGSDQVAVQRYLSTPSLRAAQRSVWIFVVFNILIMVALMFCGLALFAFHAQRAGVPLPEFQQQIAAQADRIMPQFIVAHLPPGVSGLILAALLAAAMSSLSSGINSISSAVVSDFLQRFGLLGTQQDSLKVDKLVSIAAGLVGVAVALTISISTQRTDWNLLELGGRLNHIFVGPLAVLFFSGILFRWVGARAAFLGFLLGVGTSLLVCFGREWFALSESISFLWAIPIPFLVGLMGAGLLGFLVPSPKRESNDGLRLREQRRAGSCEE
ncbi:MAG: sodium/solute symporter [Acidobacteriota bacterium]